jgi:hypothetical protein
MNAIEQHGVDALATTPKQANPELVQLRAQLPMVLLPGVMPKALQTTNDAA